MTKLRATAFCLAILTLAGCSQAPADPAKAAADKPGAVQSQPPPANLFPDSGGGNGGGNGGGGY